jgi:hypothetical protein
MQNADVLNCGCFLTLFISSFYILPSGWRFFSSLVEGWLDFYHYPMTHGLKFEA